MGDRVRPDPESYAQFFAALDAAIERRVNEREAEAAGLEVLAAAVEAAAAILKAEREGSA
ncbi:hypothetical protein AMK09_00660 [Streptomyces sp. CB02488]|uniref:hypothetical protein n=1 Tax=Streptomyces sp. CB02488 TaxID=1703920 RepID=UPI00093CF1DD|nr:hypothetical protein [Streptomyces sp. CB02488]OKK24750.1 hypothetical protein AMK09_00660 [Streptomyces sp. CB02488]